MSTFDERIVEVRKAIGQFQQNQGGHRAVESGTEYNYAELVRLSCESAYAMTDTLAEAKDPYGLEELAEAVLARLEGDWL